MSTPRSLSLPESAHDATFETSLVDVGAIVVEPESECIGTALLVPGFTGSAEDFIHLFPPLTRCGWRVVAIDLPGQKASPGPNDESAYALDALADALAEVIAALDAPHVVGHSLGGLIVQTAVARGARPTSVTLLCSGASALPELRHGPLPLLVQVLPAMPMEQIWTVKEQLDRENGWDPGSPEVYEFTRQRFIAHNPYALRAMATILLEGELLARLPDELPLLVAYGADDDAWPIEHQQDLAARHGGLGVRIPLAGHSPAVDRPEHTAALLTAFWGGRRGFGSLEPGYHPAVDVRCELPHDSSAAGLARARIALLCDSDAAALVATELVANALNHAVGPLSLELIVDADVLTVRVTDGDPHSIPLELDAADLAVTGRGLALVNSLATDWGWWRDDSGKTVWASVPLSA